MKRNFAFLMILLALWSSCLHAQEQEQEPRQEQPQPRPQQVLITPDIMKTGTLEEQLNYLHQRTNIYNNFRAIREDLFQKMKSNTIDSMKVAKEEIRELNNRISSFNVSVDSINHVLKNTRDDLQEAEKNRDNLKFLGIPMNKSFYKSLMWAIVGGLLILTIIVFTLFNRNRIITGQTTKEMDELRDEFEAYRKTNREKMEKMVIEHFNEIKRIKGS